MIIIEQILKMGRSISFDKLSGARYFDLKMAFYFAFLMFIGWPMSPVPLSLFIGLVPLLLIEHKYSVNRSRKAFFRFWGSIYLGFLLWNVLTTWWVINASVVGGIAAFTINSLS